MAKYDRRKVVVATNVAETSLTIDGVRLVIDSGLARIPRYDPYRGINTLLIEKISRASADQRAGRAGRTAPGHCLRLWTAHEQNERAPQELSEVKRLDLAEVILTLKASGVDDVRTFRWLEAPDARALERAETLLADLGAIDDATGAITPLGRRMLAFPVHPRYARMLLAAQDYGCVRPIALIAALTQGRDLLARRQGTHAEDGRDDADRRRDRVGFFCADARLALRRAKRLPDGPLPPVGDQRPSGAAGRAALRAVLAHRGRGRFGHQRKARWIAPPCSVVCWLAFPTISRNVSTPALDGASWFMAGAARWRARAS